MEQLQFPHYADSGNRILMWKADQFFPMFVMAFLGVATNSLTYTLPLGFVMFWLYGKYSAGRPDGFLLHAAYWHGLLGIKARSAINPFHRRILPK